MIDAALARAEREISAGRFERAASLLEAMARRFPSDPRAALRYCSLVAPETDATVERAIEGDATLRDAASRCLSLLNRTALDVSGHEPHEDEIARWRSWAAALLGEPEAALARLEARAPDETDVASLLLLAALSANVGRLTAASRALELSLRVRPNDVAILRDLAMIHLARGDAARAVALLLRVVAVQPDDPEVHRDLAGALLQAGETVEAVSRLERLAENEPASWQPRTALAQARLELGQVDRAVSDARRALSLAPGHEPLPALVLADALREAGSPEARAAYEEVLRRDPSSTRARRALEALGSR